MWRERCLETPLRRAPTLNAASYATGDMHQFGSGFAPVLHIIRTMDIVMCRGKLSIGHLYLWGFSHAAFYRETAISLGSRDRPEP
ncbi:Hypothetical predicted protein [Cloeon dipterum]|uniref:Uncharacterized protein n=1 Tax=Cloeon dipterum TaxID=197152 RepID=A0A8S1E5A2_9INSE|nr:Hypothetical predicted protein [Cloeon dipterum]